MPGSALLPNALESDAAQPDGKQSAFFHKTVTCPQKREEGNPGQGERALLPIFMMWREWPASRPHWLRQRIDGGSFVGHHIFQRTLQDVGNAGLRCRAVCSDVDYFHCFWVLQTPRDEHLQA